MGNQMSAVTARDGSIGHDIETGGSPHHGVDQIEMTTTAPAAGGGGGGGAAHHQEEEEADMERKRDSGIFTSIGGASLSVGATAFFRRPPKGLQSVAFLIVAYWLDIIMLLILGILLLGLTFALPHVPDNWVPAVRASATTVTVALLVLLLFLVASVTYGLVRQDLP